MLCYDMLSVGLPVDFCNFLIFFGVMARFYFFHSNAKTSDWVHHPIKGIFLMRFFQRACIPKLTVSFRIVWKFRNI